MAIQFTDANFEQDVIEASKSKPVLVDFFADWCSPCQMQGPIIEALSNEFSSQASIGKLDTEANQQTAIKYNVMSIPTLLLFKDGEIKETMIGVQSKDGLTSLINKYL